MSSTSRSFQGGSELPLPFMLTTVTPHVMMSYCFTTRSGLQKGSPLEASVAESQKFPRLHSDEGRLAQDV